MDWRVSSGGATGKLVTFRQNSSFEHARQGLADPQQQQVLSAAECAQLEPALMDAPFVGAIYTPDEEVGDCHGFCQQLAARLQASGRCEFRLGQAVTGIRHGHGSVNAIELGEHLLPVEQLVIAAGHRSPLLALPGLQLLPLYPLKGYSLTVPIGVGHRVPDVSITDYDRKIVYARIGEQLRVAAMVDIVGFDPAWTPSAWH